MTYRCVIMARKSNYVISVEKVRFVILMNLNFLM